MRSVYVGSNVPAAHVTFPAHLSLYPAHNEELHEEIDWGLHAKDFMRRTSWEGRHEKDFMRRTSWEGLHEKDFMRRTSWEKLHEKDFMRRTSWEGLPANYFTSCILSLSTPNECSWFRLLNVACRILHYFPRWHQVLHSAENYAVF